MPQENGWNTTWNGHDLWWATVGATHGTAFAFAELAGETSRWLMGSRDRSDSRWEVVMAGFNLNERNERTWNKDWIILVGKSLSTLCHIRHVADSLGLQDDGKGWFWLVAGQNPGGSQSPLACRVLPKSKSVPGVPCKHMQSLFILWLWRLWVLMEDMEDMERACVALCFGTWFGLWPRPQAFISTSWNHLPLGQSRLA